MYQAAVPVYATAVLHATVIVCPTCCRCTASVIGDFMQQESAAVRWFKGCVA